eukprot:TRINITY_DN1081_c0_g4_i1.p2 TRINITY_DN1081_c0_g4~~TRINITY_DN1081_c0_g4_i1.p2  ORF type:complete len:463 (+),score=162.86 TRINITY_DN1081_c0_g4_i1:90-1478(+)
MAPAGKIAAALAAAAIPAASAATSAQDTWAVIAAGSSGFMNYRHQADACHAYHTLINAGVPAEQIILMMQDDVANSEENPFPGQLFNKPGDDAKDVYAGCKVDYKGSQVTAQLFMDVLTGNADGTPKGGKVLKSGPSNRVFLNFVDHGGVNIIAFPNGPVLHNTELQTTLDTMREKKMFKEVLFYMEACESGSMFPKLSTSTDIYAVTAANGQESSWGFYCSPDDKVKGKSIGSCLGDLFSISWMEDTDAKGGSETIKDQVAAVTKRTSKSHVSTFGDTSFVTEPIGNFEFRAAANATVEVAVDGSNAVDTRDIPLRSAMTKYEQAETEEERMRALHEMEIVIKQREEDEMIFKKFAEKVCEGQGMGCDHALMNLRHESTDLECHKKLVHLVFDHCPKRSHRSPGGWNGFNMRFSQVLVNACEVKQTVKKDVGDLEKIIQNECRASASRWYLPEEADATVVV